MLNKVLTKMRKDGIGATVQAAVHKSRMWYNKPSLQVTSTSLRIVRLGSSYGGWDILDVPSRLSGASVVTCGAGEDITFDVALAQIGCRVVIVDPTPRAVRHVTEVLSRVGEASEASLVNGGRQVPEAYNLSAIESGQITLVIKALWTEAGTVKFFEPCNAENVSHSIVNIQNDQDQNQIDGYIEVPATTLETLLSDLGIDSLELLKLDIEGAEIAVLTDLARGKLRPTQLLVEFDGLLYPSSQTTNDVRRVDAILRGIGYRCYHTDGQANYLYALQDQVERLEQEALTLS